MNTPIPQRFARRHYQRKLVALEAEKLMEDMP